MASHLSVPTSQPNTLRRQASATRITVSTVRKTSPSQPIVAVDSVPLSKEPTSKVQEALSAPTKSTKSRSKLRARRRRLGGDTFSEGEDEASSDRVVSEDDDDEDEDDEAEDEDDEDDESGSDASSSDSDDDEVEPSEAVPETSDIDGAAATLTDTSAAAEAVASERANDAPQKAETTTPSTNTSSAPVSRGGSSTYTSNMSENGKALSWAAIAEADDDDEWEREAAAEVEQAKTKADVADSSAAKSAIASSKEGADAANISAKERKKLKAKERKLRKKAEFAAAAATSDVAGIAPAPASAKSPGQTQPTPSAEQAERTQPGRPPVHSRVVQENYRERLAKDPTYTPRLGNFWGHDERLIDGDLRKLSGWWRGRGGRGGSVGGPGRGASFASARADARLERGGEITRDQEQAQAGSEEARIPPHLRQARGSAGRGGPAAGGRGGSPSGARGGRGGTAGRGGFSGRGGLGAGSFGAYAPGTAPPGRSKLRGWDDEEDLDDGAEAVGMPKVDYDALEGKAVREPSRAARPPPTLTSNAWGHGASENPAPDGRRRDGGPAQPNRVANASSLAGVPTAPRAMLKAAAEAAANESDRKAVSPQPLSKSSEEGPAAASIPESAEPSNAGGKWAHDGFEQLQQVETTRGAKRSARGGRGGAVAATRAAASPRRGARENGPEESRAKQVSSPSPAISPPRDGVPLTGKDGVFVSQSASRSNSVAGRDSPVVFGSVHGSTDEHGSKKVEYNPRAASFALAAEGPGSIRLPGTRTDAQERRPAPPQQANSYASTNGSRASYPTHLQGPSGPGRASPADSAVLVGTPPLYPVPAPLPVTMAPSLPPGFAVDSTGMVFNLTGGQPVAVGYLPPMAAAPMGPYYAGSAYGEDPYGARISPASSAYHPSGYTPTPPFPSQSTTNTSQPTEVPQKQAQSPSSPAQARKSPVQSTKEPPRALPPHMQAGMSRSSVLGKHARTISTLPASAAKVPAFRPSAGPTSPAPPSNPSGNDSTKFSAYNGAQSPAEIGAYRAGSGTGATDGQGQAILEHAMSQVHLHEQNGYAGHYDTAPGTGSPYGMDAYAPQISPPMGTVYFQPPPGAAGSAPGYHVDPYGTASQHGYASPGYYPGAEMYEGDPAFFPAAYDRQ